MDGLLGIGHDIPCCIELRLFVHARSLGGRCKGEMSPLGSYVSADTKVGMTIDTQ
jgi:hypothetical protein